MPEETEYLHAVQIAIDIAGIHYQVMDIEGKVRERLDWPVRLPKDWTRLQPGRAPARTQNSSDVLYLRLNGTIEKQVDGRRQTLVTARKDGENYEALWIGLSGERRRLTITLQPLTGRSPHYWFGPEVGDSFDLYLALHFGMGPGGLLLRDQEGSWTSLETSSAWGLECLGGAIELSVAQHTKGQKPFSGARFEIAVGDTEIPKEIN